MDSKQNTDKLLLKVTEAADMLSIARSKAYVLVQTGELPSVRLGNSIRIPSQKLREYVDQLSGVLA